MNIKQAKQEVKNTLRAYLSKDELGCYRIPSIRQRPILLMGPPGIGKTQIMEQIAKNYQGEMVVEAKEHRFHVKVMMEDRKNDDSKIVE